MANWECGRLTLMVQKGVQANEDGQVLVISVDV